MNYYVARDFPYPILHGSIIGFSSTTAERWDVKYIMKTGSDVPANELYLDKSEYNSSFYLQKTDKLTYDVLDAFGVPHMNKAGHEIKYSRMHAVRHC
jgi:hypothetical protein